MEPFPEKYRHDIAIIRETAEQIAKDLSIADFKFIFSGDAFRVFDELKEQLEPVIIRLFEKDSKAFQALIYRIDINESDYKIALSKAGTNDFKATLTELIIRREFQKVLIRKFFSSRQ